MIFAQHDGTIKRINIIPASLFIFKPWINKIMELAQISSRFGLFGSQVNKFPFARKERETPSRFLATGSAISAKLFEPVQDKKVVIKSNDSVGNHGPLLIGASVDKSVSGHYVFWTAGKKVTSVCA